MLSMFCTIAGGVISPLPVNLLLDDLDKEPEKRGHRFCRHADDCNIYGRSLAAGERVMAAVTTFLQEKLRLRVNRQRSAVAPVEDRQFLGHRLKKRGGLGIGRKSLKRAQDRLRDATRRNRGMPPARVSAEVNRVATGWVTYYRDAACASVLKEIDGWLRRKLRCVKLKHCKNPATIAVFLTDGGVAEKPARQLASSGEGWWRLANTGQAKQAMPGAWVERRGLISLSSTIPR